MYRSTLRTLAALLVAVTTVASVATIVPTTAGAAPTDPAATADGRFVGALYEDFLDRAGSPTEVAAKVAEVRRDGRDAVVARFANSSEWVSALVTGYYRSTLDRAPDAAGLAHWTTAIQRGMTAARAAAHFYGSPEYFARSGGTPRAWVADLYEEILDRAPDAAGLSHWAAMVGRGVPRDQIAASFYGSVETRRARVAGLYEQLLDRAPDAQGWTHWTTVLADGHDVRLATSLASSPEYYLRATGERPQPPASAAVDPGPAPSSGGGSSAPATGSTSTTTTPAARPATGSTFVHPGVLLDRTQLDLVKAKVAAGQEPWASALDRAQSSGGSIRTDRRPTRYRYAGLDYVPAPVAVLQAAGSSGTAYMTAHPELGLRNIGGTEHLDDAQAAYTHALLWYLTGNRAHAAKAIEIMDAWSGTLTEIKFDQPRRSDTGGQLFDQGKLQAGWGGSLFARAAEIVRHTGGGWSDAGVARFEDMLRDVYLPLVITGWTSGANWLMTFAEATMGIGVFTDDRATFDAGVRMWRQQVPASIYLPGDGSVPLPPDPWFGTADRIRSLWHQPTAYVAGLEQETLRDLSHTMMGMGAMANAAETARIQGVDLFGEQRARIVTSFELHARYVNEYLDEKARLGGAEPSSSWVPSGWVGRDFDLGGVSYRAGWEVAFNHYARAGQAMPNTARLVQRLRPATSNMHLSWETLTHAR